jgi:hypothetical protein
VVDLDTALGEIVEVTADTNGTITTADLTAGHTVVGTYFFMCAASPGRLARPPVTTAPHAVVRVHDHAPELHFFGVETRDARPSAGSLYAGKVGGWSRTSLMGP